MATPSTTSPDTLPFTSGSAPAAPVPVAYSSMPYGTAGSYMTYGTPTASHVPHSGQNVHVFHGHGIWTQLAQSGIDIGKGSFDSSIKSNDDIIQKSLAISGISQEMIEAAQTPKHDSACPDIPNPDPEIIEIGDDQETNEVENEFESPNTERNDPLAESSENVAQYCKKCDACGEYFDNAADFNSHVRSHTEVCPYECASCNALFRLSTQLMKHVKSCKMANQTRPYPCPKCDRAFDKKIALQRHLSQHDETKVRFTCDVCEKTFASEAYMEKHKLSHAQRGRGQKSGEDQGASEQTAVDAQAGDEQNAGDEISVENGEDQEGLEDRRDVFRSLRKRPRQNFAELQGSDIDEEEDVQYVIMNPKPKKNCHNNNKTKASAKETRVRPPKAAKPRTVKKKKFRCGKCDLFFDTYDLRLHHVATHLPGEKEHMCMICGKSYTMACNLERHSLVHTNTRLHKCDICGKGFHRVDILDRHRRIHTGERPHDCPSCDMKFISTSALLLHNKRMHTERPYRCTNCGEAYFTSDRLERHMKMHETNRRYTCDMCGKSFINSSNLKTHIRIHTKEKPFVCDLCGERFTQKAHVDRHVLTHTKPAKDTQPVPLQSEAMVAVRSQLHYCKICGKSFPKRRGLRMHERMRHGVNRVQKPKVESKPEHLLQNNNVLMQEAGGTIHQLQSPNWFQPVVQHQISNQQQQQQISNHHQSAQQPVNQQQLHLPTTVSTTIHHHNPQQQQSQLQQQLQQPQPQQQQQQQYSVSVYNTNNTNVYTQQYMPQNQHYDIQIQNLGQDEPVVFTAADSHDTIMYLIEAAASSNIMNQPLQQTQEIQILSHQQLPNRYDQMQTVQIDTGGVESVQHVQVQSSLLPQQTAQKPSSRGGKRGRIEKNAPGSKPYMCTSCGEHFTSSSVLIKHMRTHTGEKPFACMTCGKAFSQIGNLHRHTKSHQGVRNHRCNVCGKSFTRRERLLYHVKLHTGEKNFKCGDCGKEFAHKTNLMAHHNRKHSLIKPHKCDLCDKSFAEARALMFHKKVHDPKESEKNHVCDTCGKAFTDVARLLKHARIHSDDRPHKCQFCGKTYTLPSSLKNHLQAHHALEIGTAERSVCDICNKEYPTKYQLQSHLRTHRSPKFSCDVCGKKFTISSNLTMHKRIHNGERPFKCSTCDQTFTQRGHLLRHSKICRDKKYKCSECFSSFYLLDSLSRHINKFHGVQKKKFACEQCDLHFSSSASLTRHVKKEHRAKFTCGECDEGFDNEAELEGHACGVKAEHSCEVCGKAFKDEETLSEHCNTCSSKGETGKAKETHVCLHCGKVFKSSGVLTRHVKQQHPELSAETVVIYPKDSKDKARKPKPFKCASCDQCFSAINQLKNHMKSHVGEKFDCRDCGLSFASKPRLEMHREVCVSNGIEDEVPTNDDESAQAMDAGGENGVTPDTESSPVDNNSGNAAEIAV